MKMWLVNIQKIFEHKACLLHNVTVEEMMNIKSSPPGEINSTVGSRYNTSYHYYIALNHYNTIFVCDLCHTLCHRFHILLKTTPKRFRWCHKYLFSLQKGRRYMSKPRHRSVMYVDMLMLSAVLWVAHMSLQ